MRELCGGEAAVPELFEGSERSLSAQLVVQCRHAAYFGCEIQGHPLAEFKSVPLDDIKFAVKRAWRALAGVDARVGNKTGRGRHEFGRITLRISGPKSIDLLLRALPIDSEKNALQETVSLSAAQLCSHIILSCLGSPVHPLCHTCCAQLSIDATGAIGRRQRRATRRPPRVPTFFIVDSP